LLICVTQLVGYCDEILDAVYLGKSDSHLAVASNSPDIKLYRLKDMHCVLLKGHTDLVLALATSHTDRNLLASTAKVIFLAFYFIVLHRCPYSQDNKVKLWLLNEERGEVSCIATGERHTASVGAVAFSKTSAQWLYTGAQDNCIKAWKIGTPGSLAILSFQSQES